MSHQPSTTESIKNTIYSAYDSATTNRNAICRDEPYDPNQDKQNFKKDAYGNVAKKGDFKDKLNSAALGKPIKEETYVEKSVGMLQQSVYQQGKLAKQPTPPGPPERPDHDVQVEEFIRNQYHSHSGDGMPNPDRKE